METMANYILSILKSSPVVLMSWGSHAFTSLENDKGLSFIVNGFVYQGKVSIVYEEGRDTFTVIIGKSEYEDIYLDELVSFIDSKVEKDCGERQYEVMVSDWLESEAFEG